MPKLILIRGLPGSGKSTMAKEIVARGCFAHVESDMYFCDLYTGEYKFDAKRIGMAHSWCLTKVKRLLVDGYNVVVSNTFTQRWEMQPYLDLGAETEITVARGNFKSLHNVPETTLQAMRLRWED